MARTRVPALPGSDADCPLHCRAVGPSVALFRAGMRRQATYRLALLSGLATNVFFGVVRTALFVALYSATTEVGGFDEADALTYVWVLQALFGAIWTPWIFELPDRIRSGDFVAELTRPGDPLVRHVAFDLGRVSYFLLLRAPGPLFVAAIVLDLNLPTSVVGWAAFVVSVLLAAVVSTQLRFLIGAVAFWSPDYRGIFALVFIPIWFFSGFLIPTTYFPDLLQTVADLSPLVAMLMAPVAVATRQAVAGPLVIQLVWAVVMWVVCQRVMHRADRRLVVFGG